MMDRKRLLVVGGICTALVTTRVVAGPSFLSTVIGTAVAGAEDEDDKKAPTKHAEHGEHDEHAEKGEDEDDEGKGQNEIEQAVPMNMIAAAILDAVKKEVPNGTITEAGLVAKHHKIVYSFDVKAGDQAYDVEISVDGKFVSKKADDDGDEKDAKKEKKPEMPEKK